MKQQRSLSGIFFRMKNEETGLFEAMTFEDLTLEQQNAVMAGKSAEWMQSLAVGLANTINRIAAETDLRLKS